MVVEEVEKSHDLPSASPRPRKASGGVLVQPKGLGTRGTNVVSFSLNLKAREPGPAESKSTLPLPFSCTGRPHFIVSHFIALHRGCDCASQRLCFPWFCWFQNIEGKTFHQQKNCGSFYCNTHFIVVVWKHTVSPREACTVVIPYLWGIHFNIPSRCL